MNSRTRTNTRRWAEKDGTYHQVPPCNTGRGHVAGSATVKRVRSLDRCPSAFIFLFLLPSESSWVNLPPQSISIAEVGGDGGPLANSLSCSAQEPWETPHRPLVAFFCRFYGVRGHNRLKIVRKVENHEKKVEKEIGKYI